MSETLFGDVEPNLTKWTERMMLDLLHDRYASGGGNGPRYVVAEHVRNQAGFGGYWGTEALRTADAIAVDLWPSAGNLVHGFEVKVSRSDWLTELKDPTKADAFRRYCDHWWLVVPEDTIVRDDLPEGWGLLAVGSNSQLRIKRRSPKLDRQPMTPSFMASLLRATAKTAQRRAA